MSIVAIRGIVIAAFGNGVILTAGLASQNGAKTSEKMRDTLFYSLVCKNTEERQIFFAGVFLRLPSHAIAEKPVTLTVVGKKRANVLLRC